MTLLDLSKQITDLYPRTLEEKRSSADADEQRSEPRLPCNDLAYLVWIDTEGSRQWQRIHLVDKSEHGVGFKASQSVPVGQMVWVELDGELCRATVRFMKEHDRGYRGGLRRVQQDRRESERVPVLGTGMLHFSDVSTPTIIRNVSANGVQIETAIEVPVSEVVRLSGATVECLAITRYCRGQDTHYLSGLEVLSQPSEEEPIT